MREYLLGDIAYERSESCKLNKEDYPIVGLEHITPEQVILSEWSLSSDNTFTKLFHEKDVLFGRRRAYLKKAAVAPFSGICSGDITVIVAKEELLCPDLLPFIIQNDKLFDYAVKMSAGGLSPRVKWKDLKEFTVVLPDMTKQEELAELLWSIEYTKQSYKKLLEQTDELVKSQFIEMFSGCRQGLLSEVSIITMGQSPDGKTYNNDGEGVPFYQGKTEFEDLYIGDPVTWTTAPTRFADADDVLMSVRAPVGSTNLAKERCCLGRGLAGIKAIEGKSTALFILYSMRSIESQIENMGVGSTFKAINKDQVYKLPIPIASLVKQTEFVQLAEQSDKSKFELKKTLDELTALQKKIIEQNLTQ